MMSDEFDDIVEPCSRKSGPRPGQRPAPRTPSSAPRLAARLFAESDLPLRARLIACLLRPLGPLGLAGVAAGAFAAFLNRHELTEASADLARVARVSSEQIHELARFVEEVEPQALQHFAELISGSQLALAAFSASALALLYDALRQPSSAGLATTIGRA
jgi:hypothetical protein